MDLSDKAHNQIAYHHVKLQLHQKQKHFRKKVNVGMVCDIIKSSDDRKQFSDAGMQHDYSKVPPSKALKRRSKCHIQQFLQHCINRSAIAMMAMCQILLLLVFWMNMGCTQASQKYNRLSISNGDPTRMGFFDNEAGVSHVAGGFQLNSMTDFRHVSYEELSNNRDRGFDNFSDPGVTHFSTLLFDHQNAQVSTIYIVFHRIMFKKVYAGRHTITNYLIFTYYTDHCWSSGLIISAGTSWFE